MDWKNIIGAVAPVLGTALGGPLGGMAVATISQALGLSEQTEDAISNAISGAKPDDLLKLKQADQQFAKEMKALDIDLDRIAVDNTKDARQMQMQTHSKVPAILAIVVTLGFFGILTVMVTGVYNASDNNALLIMLGALGASWGSIVQYYFGSSMSSARKDGFIAFGKT